MSDLQAIADRFQIEALRGEWSAKPGRVSCPAAPGRSQLLTSTASISCPSTARGNGRAASDRRSRAVSIRPWFTAPCSAPWPRRCSGAKDRPARLRTGPPAHSTASASSKPWSLRAVRHAWNSRRNPASTPNTSGPAPASAGKLSITAFVRDHAEAVLTHPIHRDHPAEAARKPRSQPRRLENKLRAPGNWGEPGVSLHGTGTGLMTGLV